MLRVVQEIPSIVTVHAEGRAHHYRALKPCLSACLCPSRPGIIQLEPAGPRVNLDDHLSLHQPYPHPANASNEERRVESCV